MQCAQSPSPAHVVHQCLPLFYKVQGHHLRDVADLMHATAACRAATLLQSCNVAYKYGISGPFWYALPCTHHIPYDPLCQSRAARAPRGFCSAKFAIMLVHGPVEKCALTYEHAANVMSGQALNPACTAGTLLVRQYRSCYLASWQSRSSAKRPLLTPCRRSYEHAGARWPML